jgi:glycosyltransferase involved in cell wall biosynthesis
VVPLAREVIALFDNELPQYDLTIQFIDNHSEDGTREKLEMLCEDDSRVRVIFNSRNFKGSSALYGLLQSNGDCSVYLSADFQDPICKIPELLSKWEEGYLVVAAVKRSTKEGLIKKRFRTLYYRLMRQYSEFGFIEGFCNFGVYDKRFLDIIRGIDNPNYSIRGNVVEYGYKIAEVEYDQQERRSGHSNYSFVSLMNLGITNFIDYTDVLLRWAILAGGLGSTICAIVALVYLVRKLINWSGFAMGVAPVLVGVFLVGALNMFLLGIIGEYVLSVRRKVTSSPLVIEERRVNFCDEDR